jgi:hypothetical protein
MSNKFKSIFFSLGLIVLMCGCQPVIDSMDGPLVIPASYTVEWSGVKAAWHKTSNAAVYELRESVDSDFEEYNVYWTEETSYEFTKDSPTRYYYKVRAWEKIKNNGEGKGKKSSWSTRKNIEITFPPSNWLLQAVTIGSKDILEVYYGEEDNDKSQYAALDLSSGYFRMVYGDNCAWSSSVVVSPSFWETDGIGGLVLNQGNLNELITWTMEDSQEDLVLNIQGSISTLFFEGTIRIEPPSLEDNISLQSIDEFVSNSISAVINMNTSGAVNLAEREAEAFKPVMISSMHIDEDNFDSCGVFVGESNYSYPEEFNVNVFSDVKKSGSAFGVYGGLSDWQVAESFGKTSPSVSIALNQSLDIRGWKSSSTDDNPCDSDNVGLWAASDEVLSNWEYTMIVSVPNNPILQVALQVNNEEEDVEENVEEEDDEIETEQQQLLQPVEPPSAWR